MTTAAVKGKWNPAHHPRDARGRFTKSATRVLKPSDAKKAKAAIAGFKPVDLGAGSSAGKAWLAKTAKQAGPYSDATDRYFAGDWKTVNPSLRTKKDADQAPDVVEMDGDYQPLPDDVMLERRIPLAQFAHIPIDQLEGMKVRDAAPQSTMLQGADGDAPDGMVTLHMAVPAGTRAIVNPDDAEILLDRDTETAISRAVPNGRGGWDLYGVVIPKTSGKPADKSADNQGGAGQNEKPGLPGTATTGDKPARPADKPADNAPATSTAGTGTPPAAKNIPPAGDVGSGEPATAKKPAADTPARTGGPAGSKLAGLTPVDQATLAVAVEDEGPGIFQSPFTRGSFSDVGRYVSEGSLKGLTDRYGHDTVWGAVEQYARAHPDVLARSVDEVNAGKARRAAAAGEHATAAAAASKAGKFSEARTQIDAGELIDPGHRENQRSWDQMRAIVARIETRKNSQTPEAVSPLGDNLTAAPATPAVDMPAGAPTPRQLDAMLTAAAYDPPMLPPLRQTRAQLLNAGWATPTGRLTPAGHDAARRAAPDRYRQATESAQHRRTKATDTSTTPAQIAGQPTPSTAGTSAPRTGDAALTAAPIGLHRDSNPPLNDEQRTALSAYQDGSIKPGATTSYAKVNAALRTGKPGNEAAAGAVAGIDSAMAASPLTADVEVYRGVNDRRRMFTADDLTGMTWREDAYVSTGPREADAAPFAGTTRPVVMRVRVPAGTGAVDMFDPADPSEQELLLDRGHQLRVAVDNGVVDGVRRLDVDVLPKTGPADTSTQAGPDQADGEAAKTIATAAAQRRLAAHTPAAVATTGQFTAQQFADAPLSAIGDPGLRPGDVVMRQTHGKIRAGIVTQVDGQKVEVATALPGDDYAGLSTGLAGVDIRKVPTSAGSALPTPAPTQPAPAARTPYESITRQADPFALVAGGNTADDPFAAMLDRRPAGPRPQDTAGGTAAGAYEQDIFGNTTAFAPQSRATIGVAERGNLGRDTGALVQQLGMFDVSDQKQFDGQTALLDSLMDMPATPPPASVQPAAPDIPDLPTAVPDDLDTWSDEQLSGLFAELNDAPDGAVDHDGMARIIAVWDAREQAMTELVATVPDDLGSLDHDQVAALFATLTSHPGTIDTAVVARLEADLDRRDQEHVAALADLDTKRALLAKPVEQYTGDDELAAAVAAAADLGDEAASDRILAEWDRREQAAAETARLQAVQQHQAEVAAAQAATAQAAAAEAAARRRSLEQQMVIARTAGALPRVSTDQVHRAHTVLGPQRLHDLLGGEPDQHDPQILADLPETERARIVYAAAGVQAETEFADATDRQLIAAISEGLFGRGTPGEQDRSRRASRERSRRELVTASQANEQLYESFRRDILTADVTKLRDAELAAAPALIGAMYGPDGEEAFRTRLPAITAETDRRLAAAADQQARLAAGPAGPARVANPVAELGGIERITAADTGYGYRAGDARTRLGQAKRRVYGLPDTAADKDVNTARRNDPRPVAEQAGLVLAWYRHLGDIALADDRDPGLVRDWMRGPADDPTLPDVVPALPALPIRNADKVWDALKAQAVTDRNNGDDTGADRFAKSLARAYGVPYDDTLTGKALLDAVLPHTSAALRSDDRTPKQRAASFVAEWQRLADQAGVDPADELRYGPRPKTSRTAQHSTWRESTPTQEAQINALIAGGRDWLDAYAYVHNLDPATLHREEAAGEARSTALGTGGNTLKAYRQHYEEQVYSAWKAAEEGTRGHLLNDAGKKAKIDPLSLFSGPNTRAMKYASEELRRWWGEHPPPRMTFAEFKAQIAGGNSTATQARVNAGKGNEFV